VRIDEKLTDSDLHSNVFYWKKISFLFACLFIQQQMMQKRFDRTHKTDVVVDVVAVAVAVVVVFSQRKIEKRRFASNAILLVFSITAPHIFFIPLLCVI